MKRTLLVISCVLASLAMLAQGNDMGYFEYIPFVKKGKQWHVVQNDFGYNCRFDHYMINGEVVKNGKTYLRMSSSEDDLAVADDEGLLREEDRKVYFIGPDMQEFLLFDYSLKTGDTYETYSYDHHKMVKYKVLSVEDYTEGPEFICYDYDEKTGSLITHRRYLRKWVVASDIEEELYLSPKTWIEGVGSVEGPLANLTDDRPISSRLFLAYVDDNNGDLYLPFSFQDTTWKQGPYSATSSCLTRSTGCCIPKMTRSCSSPAVNIISGFAYCMSRAAVMIFVVLAGYAFSFGAFANSISSADASYITQYGVSIIISMG